MFSLDISVLIFSSFLLNELIALTLFRFANMSFDQNKLDCRVFLFLKLLFLISLLIVIVSFDELSLFDCTNFAFVKLKFTCFRLFLLGFFLSEKWKETLLFYGNKRKSITHIHTNWIEKLKEKNQSFENERKTSSNCSINVLILLKLENVHWFTKATI